MSLEPNVCYPRLHFAFYQDDIQSGTPGAGWCCAPSCKIIIYNLKKITADSPIMQPFFAAEQVLLDAKRKDTTLKKGRSSMNAAPSYDPEQVSTDGDSPYVLTNEDKQRVINAQISKCGLLRVVHHYKNLLTEGDVDGKDVYQLKSEAGAFLQNPSLRLPIAYPTRFTRKKNSEYTDLHIDIIRNTAVPATIINPNGEQRDLTDTELARLLQDFGQACFLDLELYIQERQAEALRTQTEPDFYGFQPLSDWFLSAGDFWW